jgi:hypothetical protein
MAAPDRPDVEPFWIDREYDREHASDGVSRYGAYVRQGMFDPWTDEGRHIELAVFAWRQATTPVMAPGYVRRHQRIIAARLERSDWDGSLLAMVNLVIHQPKPLSYLRSNDGRTVWQDWPSDHDFWIDRTVWYEPGGEDLSRSRYLLCTASLRFAVPSDGLPEPPASESQSALVFASRQSVTVVVDQLNAAVGPVLQRIAEG